MIRRTWGARKPPLGTRVNPSHPLAQHLVFALHMNETGGSVLWNAVTGLPQVDLSVATVTINQRNASPHGGMTIGISAGTASNTAAMISPAVTVLVNTAITVEAFVRWQSSDSFGALITQGNTSGLYVLSTGKVQLYATAASTGGLVAGAWSHIVVTRTVANTVDYYINGKFDSTAALGTGQIAFNSLLNNNGSETFVGDISHVRIWSGRALSATEIAWLYRSPFDLCYPMQRRIFDVPAAAGGGVARQRLVNGGLTRGRLVA